MGDDPRETYYPQKMRLCGQQYEGFDPQSTEVYLNLLYTQDVLQQACGQYQAAFGLSKSSVNLLMILRHGPAQGMQLHDLGKLLLVSRANITGLIDHLEERGFVKRLVDSQDRRARLALITQNGEELLDRFMPLHYRNVKTMLQGLSPSEKETLVNLLQKMRVSVNCNALEVA